MPASKGKPPANRLIAALPSGSRQQFIAHCDLVDLEFAAVLDETGAKIRHVYFPIDSFVSLVTTLDDGHKLEVGMVGDEGMYGMSLVLGVQISPQHAMVQGAGTALRMSTAVFLHRYKQSEELRRLLQRYVYVLISQLAQTAACTRYHLLEPRLARWLLITRDRAHSDSFRLTHEFLAYMLGVRRVGITEAATALHRQGLINYSRGKIVILDARALERAACACYSQAKIIYDRTMRLGQKSDRSES